MTKLWMAFIALAIAGGYGLEAMGEGGNHEPAAADNLGHGTAKDFVRLNQIPEVIVMGLLHMGSGAVDTHGQQGLTGGAGSDDSGGGDDSDSLGGNATAGGWGGDKP